MSCTSQRSWLDRILCTLLFLIASSGLSVTAADRLEMTPPGDSKDAKHIVLIAGDEEYRSEEALPMLAKILSQKHGFRCTVLFSFGPDGAEYIDPSNQAGLRGLDALDDADLMILSLRFRAPDAQGAEHIAKYLNAGKPIIGLRTSTHAFKGSGNFDGLSYDSFGRMILGEQWVNHHGKHKFEGCRATIVKGAEQHPVLKGVNEIFCPSDVYTVSHLTDANEILMRAAVTTSLEPNSEAVVGTKNEPQQPFAWFHTYSSPSSGKTGKSFTTTGGASVDFVNEDLRRLVVNAAYHLTERDVPENADVEFVNPYYPSFFGFIREPNYWRDANLRLSDVALGSTPHMPDPDGSPEWNHRPRSTKAQKHSSVFRLRNGERIALVGNSLAERMNLDGFFETTLHMRAADKNVVFRNFGWPADEVGQQQRPPNYTEIDDPLKVFAPQTFICFFGFNESFAGADTKRLEDFKKKYRSWIGKHRTDFLIKDRSARFVLVSPIAFEAAESDLAADADKANAALEAYTKAVAELAEEMYLPYVDLFNPTKKAFEAEPGLQFTINGVHATEAGYRVIANELDRQLFPASESLDFDSPEFKRLQQAVNDKAWLHLQDYRMLNGWYVYGTRRTWDTETFPSEFQKIRKMVAVRDQYIWDMLAGKAVPDQPDDSQTGEVFIPQTMFGSRDEAFRENREPKTLTYPTPEESIAQMKVPEGFEVQLFASEREFPELANPTQIAFDSKGRLWVSCMVNYPQWLPGSARPSDRILIFEDTNSDGKADKCTPFYDKLICPTGFEFYKDGVLVVDEPRILFLRDTDGDDKADEVSQVIDGIATDDTHHAMGAWEWSPGGLLYMLEGVTMSTTLETPWGPLRSRGPSGVYVFDPDSWRIRHFRTPGIYNPWAMLFDSWGQGFIGDGTNANQHWVTPWDTQDVESRSSIKAVFDNEGMRPAVGNEFLITRQFPPEVQGQYIYGCVINMHGLPRFTVSDESDTAGFTGKRIEDFLASEDKFFRPVDPAIGPDGALWFGDWCSALIGHMQYSQRDPNRDHEHGRVYRMIYRDRPLLQPVLQVGKSIDELLEQLAEYEQRTRYRARAELRTRSKAEVLAAVEKWIASPDSSGNKLVEALWVQEGFRSIDPALIGRLMKHEDFHVRSAAVHAVGNFIELYPDPIDLFDLAIQDAHPRVRLEALRGLSFMKSAEAQLVAMKAVDQPLDPWLSYVLEHTFHANRELATVAEKENPDFFASASEKSRQYYDKYKIMTGPGGEAIEPLKIVEDADRPMKERLAAIEKLGRMSGDRFKGEEVFRRVCSNCHRIGNTGVDFGPRLDDLGLRYKRPEIMKHVLLPNLEIAKGYETVQILTVGGQVINGFVVAQDEKSITLGIATSDGKGKQETFSVDDIEEDGIKKMNASSMPEGLGFTISPAEFLDLCEYLRKQQTALPAKPVSKE